MVTLGGILLGYRIQYGPDQLLYKQNGFLRRQCMIAAALLVFVFLTNQLWPEGTMVLRQVLTPSNLHIDAMEQMIAELESGVDPLQAISVFCQELFGGT